MRMLKKFLTCLLFACAASTAQATVKIVNTTNVDFTAYSNYFERCSSWLGTRGIIFKNHTMPIDQKYINAFCDKQACDAQIHMSLHCDGEAIGFIIFTKQNGVVAAEPYKQSAGYLQGYVVSKMDDQTALIQKVSTVMSVPTLFGLK